MRERIYLDHAATTPISAAARDAYLHAIESDFNPSSLHAEGRAAHALLDDARDRVARALGVPRKNIRFTGGGSESDSLAILGAARSARDRSRRRILVSATEHHAVLHAARALAGEGFEIVVLPVDGEGRLDADAYRRELDERTFLVSIHLANNETGVLQPIPALAALAGAAGALFHTDAVQAARWLDCSLDALGVDLLSISGHKFGAPKGVGVLAMRGAIALEPLIYGGGQEYGARAGTENVPGIAAFAAALDLAVEGRNAAVRRITAIRESFEARARRAIPGLNVNGAAAPRLPNISSFAIPGIESEALLMRLDIDGIAASAGSACTSGVFEPSHVIAAMGLEAALQRGVVRFSFSPDTEARALAIAGEIFARAVDRVR
ncbi:MAG: cysteine desulfurase family protein [Candidatus Eremiobacteraeota bacterium]|nr:cysteine desulfurase family protein [Candidatus Eremiobacteraeota bacterium]